MSTPFQQKSEQDSIDRLKALESQIQRELNSAVHDTDWRKLQNLLTKTRVRRLEMECHLEGVV